MINEMYSNVKNALNVVYRSDKSRHISMNLLESMEEELLMGGTYEKKIPASYSSDPGSRFNLRKLVEPIDAIHSDFVILGGVATSHIAEKGKGKNLDEIILICSSHGHSLDLGHSRAEFGVGEVAIVTQLENGVISALYTHEDVNYGAAVISWYPGTKKGFAALPYPSQKFDAGMTVRHAINRIPVPRNTKLQEFIPELVMICKAGYERRTIL